MANPVVEANIDHPLAVVLLALSDQTSGAILSLPPAHKPTVLEEHHGWRTADAALGRRIRRRRPVEDLLRDDHVKEQTVLALRGISFCFRGRLLALAASVHFFIFGAEIERLP